LKQKYIIPFLLKDGIPPKNIPDRRNRFYGENAIKKLRRFFWVQEVRREQEHFRDAKQPGRPPEVDFDTILANRLEMTSPMMSRKLAPFLAVSA
jgi:hypothetical protein